MSELFLLQNKFQEYLLNSKNDISNHIIETETVSANTRLFIYSNAYRSRLLKALAANYPVMQAYLGHEQFKTLSHTYIDTYPSHSRSIRWFGDQLENFLRENVSFNHLPYLAELAKVEWTMTLVFDSANASVVTLEVFKHIPAKCWVDMRLIAHPSVHSIHLSWNVVPIWHAISQKKLPENFLQSESQVAWILWRKDLIHYYCSLAHDEVCALDAMLKGFSFGEICKLLCQWMDEQDVAMRAAALLKEWIINGWVAGIEQ